MNDQEFMDRISRGEDTSVKDIKNYPGINTDSNDGKQSLTESSNALISNKFNKRESSSTKSK